MWIVIVITLMFELYHNYNIIGTGGSRFKHQEILIHYANTLRVSQIWD